MKIDGQFLTSLFAFLVMTISSVGVVKKLLEKILQSVSGHSLGLSTGAKTVLGLVFSFLFMVLMSTGVIPAAPEFQDTTTKVLLPFVATGVYNILKDHVFSKLQKK